MVAASSTVSAEMSIKLLDTFAHLEFHHSFIHTIARIVTVELAFRLEHQQVGNTI